MYVQYQPLEVDAKSQNKHRWKQPKSQPKMKVIWKMHWPDKLKMKWDNPNNHLKSWKNSKISWKRKEKKKWKEKIEKKRNN